MTDRKRSVLWVLIVSMAIPLPTSAADSDLAIRSVAIVAGGRPWFLTSPLFARQSDQIFRVPSWTGTYRTAGEEERDKARRIRVRVFYFPNQEATKDLMVDPRGNRFPRELPGVIKSEDEVFGFFDGGLKEAIDDDRRIAELRVRRGSVVLTFTPNLPVAGLLDFSTQFLTRDRALGEWHEVSLTMRARDPDGKEYPINGGIQLDESYEGKLEFPIGTDVTLLVNLKRVAIRADLEGIRPVGAEPLEHASFTIETKEEIVESDTDNEGHASLSLGPLSQSRALDIQVSSTGLRQTLSGVLKLRYGKEKEGYLDQGRYKPTHPPASSSVSDVASAWLAFSSSIFDDDREEFSTKLDEDNRRSIATAAPPYWMMVVGWHLAKKTGVESVAKLFEEFLPIKESTHIGSGEDEDKLRAQFENVEAAIALYLETLETAWLEMAQGMLGPSPQAEESDSNWTEDQARRVLILWRLYEILEDVALEVQVERESKQFLAAIGRFHDPCRWVETDGKQVRIEDSGDPAPHAWAVLALTKAYEVSKKDSYWREAVIQMTHIVDRHISNGRLKFSHLQPGEIPGTSMEDDRSPGAYPELTAAIHAGLLVHKGTANRNFHEATMRLKAKALTYWRKKYGGFGNLTYWDGPITAAQDARKTTIPINSKSQASIYQQPWAVLAFMPQFYPYWGEGVVEKRRPKYLLDLLFPSHEPQKIRRRGQESETDERSSSFFNSGP